jgi:hypothetical protein
MCPDVSNFHLRFVLTALLRIEDQVRAVEVHSQRACRIAQANYIAPGGSLARKVRLFRCGFTRAETDCDQQPAPRRPKNQPAQNSSRRFARHPVCEVMHSW